MSGLVENTVAAASAAQGRQWIGVPLNVEAHPAPPIQRSREMGWSMMPRIGRPCWASATSVPNNGTPLMKDLVPSIGSSTQTNSESARSGPYSSPMMPCSGKRAAISRRIAVSAARSATVTGDRSGLSVTAMGWRKCGRIASPAASARSPASARKRLSSPTGLLFQGFEIGDDIGPVLHLRQSREAHLGALGKLLRPVEPQVKLVGVPFLALMLGER